MNRAAHAGGALLPLTPQEEQPRHHGKAGIAKEPFHHVFVHSHGGAQHASPHVGYARQLEQALNCSVLAERTVQHRKDYVDLGAAGA